MYFCIIFKSVWESNVSTLTRIYTGRSWQEQGNISSPKYPDQLQRPPSLQLNENQSFFSGSKVARADSLTTHIHLERRLKISAATPPLNLCASMAPSGANLFYLNLIPMYISLKRSHSFWSYKGNFLYITYLLHAHWRTISLIFIDPITLTLWWVPITNLII